MGRLDLKSWFKQKQHCKESQRHLAAHFFYVLSAAFAWSLGVCLGCLYRHALFDLDLADLSESHFSAPFDRAAVALDRAGLCFLSITHISEQRFVNLQVSGSSESDVCAPLDRRVIVLDQAG